MRRETKHGCLRSINLQIHNLLCHQNSVLYFCIVIAFHLFLLPYIMLYQKKITNIISVILFTNLFNIIIDSKFQNNMNIREPYFQSTQKLNLL